MVARVVKVVDCRCHGRSSFSALQLIDLSRQTVSLKVDTEGDAMMMGQCLTFISTHLQKSPAIYDHPLEQSRRATVSMDSHWFNLPPNRFAAWPQPPDAAHAWSARARPTCGHALPPRG